MPAVEVAIGVVFVLEPLQTSIMGPQQAFLQSGSVKEW
jgi:hypothetical protein